MTSIARLLSPFAAIAMAVPAVMIVDRVQEPAAPFAKPRVVRWSHGDSPIPLLPANQGFCYISGMGGNFQGGGEGVRIWIDDGTWWLGGHSCQPSLWVEATCLKLVSTVPGQKTTSSHPRRELVVFCPGTVLTGWHRTAG